MDITSSGLSRGKGGGEGSKDVGLCVPFGPLLWRTLRWGPSDPQGRMHLEPLLVDGPPPPPQSTDRSLRVLLPPQPKHLSFLLVP